VAHYVPYLGDVLRDLALERDNPSGLREVDRIDLPVYFPQPSR
jgi:hypothetical protein